MSTCFPFASSLFYKDSVTFGTRKKKIQEWLLNDLLCSVSASVFCYIKKKKGKKQKNPKNTMCHLYKGGFKLCGSVLRWVISFHVLKTTKATFPIYQQFISIPLKPWLKPFWWEDPG